MYRLIYIIALLACSSICQAQDSTDQSTAEVSNVLNIDSSDKPTLNIYPIKVVDKFRLDLKPFLGQDIKVIVLDKNKLVKHEENMENIDVNFSTYSAYTLGLSPGKYTLSLISKTNKLQKEFTVL